MDTTSHPTQTPTDAPQLAELLNRVNRLLRRDFIDAARTAGIDRHQLMRLRHDGAWAETAEGRAMRTRVRDLRAESLTAAVTDLTPGQLDATAAALSGIAAALVVSGTNGAETDDGDAPEPGARDHRGHHWHDREDRRGHRPERFGPGLGHRRHAMRRLERAYERGFAAGFSRGADA